MANLKLLNDGWHTLDILIPTTKEIKSFKIPVELTVSETETMLEIYAEIDKVYSAQVLNDGSEQLSFMKDKIFTLCYVLFKRYQPDITVDELKDILTYNDAMQISGFFQKYRILEINENGESGKAVASL